MQKENERNHENDAKTSYAKHITETNTLSDCEQKILCKRIIERKVSSFFFRRNLLFSLSTQTFRESFFWLLFYVLNRNSSVDGFGFYCIRILFANIYGNAADFDGAH